MAVLWTLYDMWRDLWDVYKTDVYKICKYLNDSGEIIPEIF